MLTTATTFIQRRLYGREGPSPREAHTLPRFLFGMVFQGIWWAGYLLVPFVLAKSLAAPGGLITLAVTMDTGGMLLAIYWGHLLSRRHAAGVILWGGFCGRLVLLATFLVGSAGQFVILMAAVYFFGSLVYPAQNGILQAGFRHRVRGRIWGLGTSIQNLAAVATSLAVGKILDHDPDLFRVAYAAIGACGFVYILILSRLTRYLRVAPSASGTAATGAASAGGGVTATAASEPASTGMERTRVSLRLPPSLPPLGELTGGRILRGLIRPFAEAVATFRRDRHYLWYEINFTVYGLAFLMTYTMLPILFRDRLQLSYEQISTARIVIAQFGVALLAPLAGRFSDRYHPARLCQLAFAVMGFFVAGLIVCHQTTMADPARLVFAVFAIYAVGMAGVNIGWNVGSISFAPPGHGSHYQGIHVSVVGIRGLLGPAIGFLVYKLLGMVQVFGLACLLLVLASLSSGALWRRLRDRGPDGR